MEEKPCLQSCTGIEERVTHSSTLPLGRCTACLTGSWLYALFLVFSLLLYDTQSRSYKIRVWSYEIFIEFATVIPRCKFLVFTAFLSILCALTQYNNGRAAMLTNFKLSHSSNSRKFLHLRRRLLQYMSMHCKEPMPKIRNKYSQKRIALPQS
jgi:hypothetical protein